MLFGVPFQLNGLFSVTSMVSTDAHQSMLMNNLLIFEYLNEKSLN